jgi:hypothetical protein
MTEHKKRLRKIAEPDKYRWDYLLVDPTFVSNKNQQLDYFKRTAYNP